MCYHAFLMEQRFKAFLRISPYSMRHVIVETLVQWFHVETGTFHLSCGENAVLLRDWMAILGLRFSGHLVPTKFVDFNIVSKLLGIRYPLTQATKWYFGPTDEPQIHMEWMKINLRLFFFYFSGSCLFDNNQSVLTCRQLSAMREVLDIRAYDWGCLFYEFFITFLRKASRHCFRSLKDCWQILKWWAYKHIQALRPQYSSLSLTIYPKAYAQSLYMVTRIVLTSLSTIRLRWIMSPGRDTQQPL